MGQPIILSKRLAIVASFLSKGTFFADIGSDHAYLPCYVCLYDRNARAIAGEINKGPYKSAQKTVDSYQLTDAIDVRLGDGLQILDNDHISELVIAGMGGSLITDILESGKQNLQSVSRIIVQPNVSEKKVRRWFLKNGYKLTNEEIIEENDHIYEVLVADKGQESNYINEIKERQMMFGPLLLKKKSAEFEKKWEYEQEKRQHIVDQMKQATKQNKEKVNQLKTELIWIKEVLRR